jgi:cell division transport system permease protein
MRGYFFRQAWRNLRQNPLMSAITLGTITISFLILGIFVIILLNAKGLMEEWGSRIQVTAYLFDGVDAEKAAHLQERVAGFAEVQQVLYRTKEEALKILEARLQGRQGLLKGLPKNPLPASLEIRLKPEYQQSFGVQGLANRLKGNPEIEDVQWGSDWVDRFSAFMALAEVLGLSLGALLLLATIFVISNTIRLSIFARKEEIEVMRSVGATGFFIRGPFYIEGILHGFFGAGLSLAVLFGLYQLFMAKVYGPLQDLLGNFPLRFLTFEQTAALALGGLILGLLGTQVSVGRFLRVTG